MKPWRPVEEMQHDEIKRYANELMREWAVSPSYSEELQAYLREAADRMEKLGLEIPRRGAHADRQE